jgi:hypothetical protein
VSEPRPLPGTDMRSGPAAARQPSQQDTGQAPAPRNPGRTRRRIIAAALAVLVAAFCATTARLFMFPARGMPPHVDAIVMLGGRGDRFHEALKLAYQHRAPYLLISLGSSFPGPEPRGSQPVSGAGRRGWRRSSGSPSAAASCTRSR